MPPEAHEDLHRDMDRLRRKATEFTDLWRLAEQGRTPCSGGEPTGSVTVTLEPGGTPALIELAQGWRSRLRGESLGAAVIMAYRSAQQVRATAFLTAVSSLPASLSEVADVDAARRLDDTPASPSADADRVPTESGSVPEAIAALEAAMRPPSALLDGVDVADPDVTRERPVVFGVGAGGVLTSCLIEPRWERFYPADQVATRLTEALHHDLARGR